MNQNEEKATVQFAAIDPYIETYCQAYRDIGKGQGYDAVG